MSKPKIKTVKAWAQVDGEGGIRLGTMSQIRYWVLPLNKTLKSLGWTIRRIKITGV